MTVTSFRQSQLFDSNCQKVIDVKSLSRTAPRPDMRRAGPPGGGRPLVGAGRRRRRQAAVRSAVVLWPLAAAGVPGDHQLVHDLPR